MSATAAFVIRTVRAAAIAVFLCALITGARPPEANAQESGSLDDRLDNQQKELERIKKEIEEHRAQSRKLGQQEKTVAKKLSALEREINLSQRFIRNLENQEALIFERVDSLRARIESEDSTLIRQKAIFARRVRQLHKRDPNYQWDILLGSDNFQQVLRRYKFTQVIAEQDAALIEEIRGRKLEFEVESAALTESLAEMAVVRNERQNEAEKLKRSKSQRQTMLAQIRTQKSQREEAIKELEKAQQEVKDLIGRLERRGDLPREQLLTESEFAALKGKMIRPVDGRVVRRFGQQKHPKYGTVTFNNGVDIGASRGAPIRAVATGLVEFVDWIDGYGKCIILNHGGSYYTLYAHVSATYVAQGQRVAGGDVIAEVGDTGSLSGYECHFEIRKSKQALNPLEWFRQ
jgi:septal ring factor EnvC (AmiA/AmiB activator)